MFAEKVIKNSANKTLFDTDGSERRIVTIEEGY
jgi:hypothetical protein